MIKKAKEPYCDNIRDTGRRTDDNDKDSKEFYAWVVYEVTLECGHKQIVHTHGYMGGDYDCNECDKKLKK